MSGRVTLSLGADSVSLEPAELDRLVRSLRQVDAPGADAVAEEIAARTLTGHVELCPTEAELAALLEALVRLRAGARDQQGLPALLDLVRGDSRQATREGGGREVVEPVVRALARGPGSAAK
jgi:hypothetical protein